MLISHGLLHVVALLLAAALLVPGEIRAETSVIDEVMDAACGKDLVLLGELPSHGEARAFAATADIVRELVERCGFDTVLFEAPIHEFELLRLSSRTGPQPMSAFDNAIGGFWITNELADWRGWLVDRAAGGLLRIGGMDDHPGATSALTRRMLPQLIANAVPISSRRMCAEAVSRHLGWAYSERTPFDTAEKIRLAECVQVAHERISKAPQRADEASLAAAFLRYVTRQAVRSDAPTRDQSMFDAVQWHRAASPFGDRLVIWTSSVHSAREPGGRDYVPLGNALAGLYGSRMLSVAFTAATGTSSMAGSPPKHLEPAPPDSLEVLALGRASESVYLDSEALKRLDGKLARVYGRFSSHPWSEHFDGMVIFRTEQAPSFPRRK